MQKLNAAIMVVLMVLVIACAPKVRTNITQKHPSLDFNEEVMVLELLDPVPPKAELLGTVKIGDSGVSSKCNYTQVIEKAKEEARKAGGNLVKIVEHKIPDFVSSCHRIKVEILRLDPAELASIKAIDEEIDPSVDYATLYVYRNGGAGALVGYNLYLGDSLIGRVTNRFKQEIRISKEGPVELWAKTEAKASLPLDIKKGKTYYIRCSVSMGVMVGHPSLEKMGKQAGKREYESTKGKKNEE